MSRATTLNRTISWAVRSHAQPPSLRMAFRTAVIDPAEHWTPADRYPRGYGQRARRWPIEVR